MTVTEIAIDLPAITATVSQIAQSTLIGGVDCAMDGAASVPRGPDHGLASRKPYVASIMGLRVGYWHVPLFARRAWREFAAKVKLEG